MSDLTIRPGRNDDAEGFIALIGACWSQYPGVLLDVDREVPELRELAAYYQGQGGMLWAADGAGGLAGMIAVRPIGDPEWEICRVYVHPSRHGSGLGHRLLDVAEAHATAAGARRLRLWSDTRFLRAHRFYEKRSFVRSGPIRVLDDISHSLEFTYGKPVDGVEVLDAAGAASAEVRLVAIAEAAAAHPATAITGGMAATHAGGAASSSAATPPAAEWRARTRQVATGEIVLLAGWVGGALAGLLSLQLGKKPHGRHRATISHVLVHPTARRQGLARAMMQAAEREAAGRSRALMMLTTGAGGSGEALCRSMGWQAAGVVPGYAMQADGSLDDAIIFWKHPAG